MIFFLLENGTCSLGCSELSRDGPQKSTLTFFCFCSLDSGNVSFSVTEQQSQPAYDHLTAHQLRVSLFLFFYSFYILLIHGTIFYLLEFIIHTVRAGCDIRSFLSRVLKVWDSELCFSSTSNHSKVKDPCLRAYLSIARRRIAGFIPFPKVLALSEM